VLVAAAFPAPAIGGSPPLPSDPRKFVQTSGKTVIDDRLTVPEVEILGGRLGGHGVIDATKVTIGPGGTLAPGNSPGVLTITGDLDITGSSFPDDPVSIMGGVLEIEIAGTDNSGAVAQFDQVHVGGTAHFAKGSSIKFIFYPDYNPHSGDMWAFLTSAGLDGLGNLTYSTQDLAANFGYLVFALGSDLYLRIFSLAGEQNALSPGQSAIPAPSSTALFLLALSLLALWYGRVGPARRFGLIRSPRPR